jgi:hypothetical protein
MLLDASSRINWGKIVASVFGLQLRGGDDRAR